jgi:uncharacterized membrane protein
MNTQRQRIVQMTTLALFIALIVLMTFTPNFGYIQTGLFSITLIHIPVIIGAAILGPIGGLVLGLTWGITSYLYALSLGTIEAMIFLNPMVSIVPRIFVGLIVSYSALALKIIKMSDWLRFALSAFIGTLSNTILVLSAIFVFASAGLVSFNQAVSTIYTIVISTNGLLELFAAIFLVPTVIEAIKKVRPNLYA